MPEDFGDISSMQNRDLFDVMETADIRVPGIITPVGAHYTYCTPQFAAECTTYC